MYAEVEATPGLSGVEDGLGEDAVLGRPGGGVGSPFDSERGLAVVEGGEDERCAAEVVRGTDDLGGGPAVGVHDVSGVEDVLDGVLGLALFEDAGGGDALRLGELGHDVGFDEVIVGWTAGHDEARGDSGVVFADAFEDAGTLLGRGRAVWVGGIAEDDDGVEVGGGGVVRWQRDVAAVDDEAEGNGQEDEEKDGSAEELHGRRAGRL